MIFCYGSPSQLRKTITCNSGYFYGNYQSPLSYENLETDSLLVSTLGLANDLLHIYCINRWLDEGSLLIELMWLLLKKFTEISFDRTELATFNTSLRHRYQEQVDSYTKTWQQMK